MTHSSSPMDKAPSTLRIELAKIEWDINNSPRAKDFGDVYFSASGGESEAEHVFLSANNLATRWASLKHNNKPFTIGEIGFGSGLNFAKTLQLWEATKDKPEKLHYIAFEKHPLAAEDMVRAHSNWPHLQTYFDLLLANYCPFSAVCYRLAITQHITLDIHFGDALSRLKTVYLPVNAGVDCWFLDGFSPRLNTELWSEELCLELARLSENNGTLSTYSAAGWVRSNLTNAGFEVTKTAGFAGKRHMLIANIKKPNASPTPPSGMATWAQSPSGQKPAKSALVIGGGLAGSSVAYALAAKGLQVQVVDSNPTPAYGASGIAQLALRPRLYKDASTLAEFYLQAFLFAGDHYCRLQGSNNSLWHQCGVLQNPLAQNKKFPLATEQLNLNYGEEIVQSIDSEQALALAKLALIGDYMYFKKGGWVDSQALCNAYLCHPNITTRFGFKIDSIEANDGHWLSRQVNSSTVLASDVVILANGIHAKDFSQTKTLPLEAVRGQATYIEANPKSEKLGAVVMGERSIFPSFNHHHTVSASYRRDSSIAHSSQDDEENLAGMANLFSETLAINSSAVSSKIALRCNSKDFLPVIGMVADAEKMQTEFAELKRNAHAAITGDGHYHEGLYITAGHGSNGVASCPLAAEHIACMVTNQASTLSQDMISQLSPARFLIRELKKQV